MLIALLAGGVFLFGFGLLLVFISAPKKEDGEPPLSAGIIDELRDTVAKRFEDVDSRMKNMADEVLSKLKDFDSGLRGIDELKDTVAKRFEDADSKMKNLADEALSKLKDLHSGLSGIEAAKQAVEQALSKNSSCLSGLDEKVKAIASENARLKNDFSESAKRLNSALNNNEMFNYRLKEEIKSALSDIEKFKNDLRRHELFVDNFARAQEGAFKNTSDRLIDEVVGGKYDIRKVFEEKYRMLESIEKDLTRMKGEAEKTAARSETSAAALKSEFLEELEKVKRALGEFRLEFTRFATRENARDAASFIDEIRSVYRKNGE